jgi:hypothetical protein
MLSRTGVRFALETALIVATAAATGLAHLGAWTIVGSVVAVWLLTSLFEYARSHPRSRLAEAIPLLDHEPEPLEHVRVLTVARNAAPEREPEPAQEPEPEGGAVRVRDAAPEPEPEAAAEPEPEAEGEPEPEPEPVPVPVDTAPWSWNVWNLERVVRERASDNEELQFLLLYLRDYASPSGMLPPDFDGLVRESFGDLLAAPS